MEEERGAVRSMSEHEGVGFLQVSSIDLGLLSVELAVVTWRDVEGVEPIQVSSMDSGVSLVELEGGARGCCCREEEKWKQHYQDGYHGNELHKLKISSVLPTLSHCVYISIT